MASWMSAMFEKTKQVATSAKDGVSAKLFGATQAPPENTDRKDVDHAPKDNNIPTTWTMPTMIMEKTKQMGTSVKNWATGTGSDLESKENADRKDVDHAPKDNIPTTWTMPTMIMEKTKQMGTSVKNWATGTGSDLESKENTDRNNVDHAPKDNKATLTMPTITEKTKQIGTSVKNWATGTGSNLESKEITDEQFGDQTPTDSSTKAMELTKTYGPYVAGAACAVVAFPVVMSLAGFGSAGIAGGSLVAYFQSVGVTGMGLGSKTIVALSGAGAVGMYKHFSKEVENPEKKID